MVAARLNFVWHANMACASVLSSHIKYRTRPALYKHPKAQSSNKIEKVE